MGGAPFQVFLIWNLTAGGFSSYTWQKGTLKYTVLLPSGFLPSSQGQSQKPEPGLREEQGGGDPCSGRA